MEWKHQRKTAALQRSRSRLSVASDPESWLSTQAITRSPLQPPDRRPARGHELTPPDDAERQRRLDWSVLMKRTWNGFDVLHCPRCGDGMRLVAAVED